MKNKIARSIGYGLLSCLLELSSVCNGLMENPHLMNWIQGIAIIVLVAVEIIGEFLGSFGLYASMRAKPEQTND